MEVIIERVHRKDIDCNDCNNPKDPTDLTVQDLDYNEELMKTNLEYYADFIQYPYQFIYEFTEAEAGVLIDAIPHGFTYGVVDEHYQSEINAIIQRLKCSSIPLMPTYGWFVRMGLCSPKDGKYRTCQFTSLDQIIEQFATSRRILLALLKGDRKIYFVPFDPSWDTSCELRVFVHDGKVTCISQYVFNKYSVFTVMSDNELRDMSYVIKDFVENILKELLSKLGTMNVVCDIYWNSDEQFRIIELNSFGYWMASGAALFHWQNDRDKLYGCNANKIYFRVYK